MAKDLTLNMGFEVDKTNLKNLKELLEELKKSAKEVPLGAEGSNKVQKHFSAAEKAFNAGDLDSFRSSINKIAKTLKEALAATGNISEALQKSLDLKNTLEKQLNQLKERESQIKSQYANKDMTHFLKNTAESNFKKYQEDNNIKFLNTNDNNKPFSREEAFTALEEAKKQAGSLLKITAEIAHNVGLADKNTAMKLSGYFTAEKKQQQSDIKEIDKITADKADISKDLDQVEKDIAKLQPASENAAKGLEELYKRIVDISSQLNTGVTKQKTEVRQAVAEKTGGGAAKTQEELTATTKGLEKQSSTLGKVFKQWTLYNIALRNVKKAMREAIKTVKDLDKALTEQAMVTGLTRKQAYDLLGTYQSMAKSLGATTKEVASTMTAFLRQGRSIQESIELSNAAIAAAKVASISTADSVNYLTTAINGFRLSAADAMKVSDKFAAVAATAATSYEEIAIAMSKVAAQANLAGMSIDYTTALLTKGLETTREAPETIGTALKTVIARMRELTDYGATLEDGMNINNVEKQLAYVGIELRNQNGELRSTEDVLNDLGSEWATLTSNQQAAIAKALAGTRQQSRLIAMMQDYERVIELQEIAERSQGATMAQMSTYLEGMGAALNKVNIAWESIVSAITDSEVIISLVNTFGSLLDNIAAFLETSWGLVPIMTAIAVLSMTHLGNKIREMQISKLQQKINLQEQIIANEKNITEQKINVNKKKGLVESQKTLVKSLENRKAKLQELEAEIQIRKTRGAIVTSQEAYLAKAKIENEKALAQARAELTTQEQEFTVEQDKLNLMEKQSTYLKSQESLINSIGTGLSGMVIPLVAAITAMKKLIIQTKAYTAQQKQAAGATAATSVAANPFWGWAAALVILAAVGLGLAVSMGAFKDTTEKEEEKIKNVGAEIYNLTEKANKLDTAINKFDTLDSKIIKTSEDLQEMGAILDGVKDNLTDAEKEIYESLQTDKMKRQFLEEIQGTAEWQANAKREQQRGLLISDRRYLTNSAVMQDALYSLNNAEAYEEVDKIKFSSESAAVATRRFAQAMLEEMSVEEQYQLMLEKGSGRMTEYVEGMAELAETLENEELSLSEQIKAYQDAYEKLNDSVAKAAFKQANQGWFDLAQFSKESLEYIEKYYKGNIDSINQMSQALQKLGRTYEQSIGDIGYLTEKLQKGLSLQQAIISTFETNIGSQEYNDILTAYEKAFVTPLLTIGQNITSFTSQINNFYDTVDKWSEMSQSEKFSFMSENADMFKGESGEYLRKALETNNYAIIQEALMNNEALTKQRKALLLDIEKSLEVEEARVGAERNEAYINELKEQKKYLEDVQNLYLVNLKTRLDKEKQELENYKEYLNKQKEALEKSLNERKDAYQKYFDAVNQEAEDQDYEDQARVLMSNLQSLTASNSASSAQKAKELEQQLKELENERLQTLRERAQEQVVSNIENEVDEINEKFDKLLESNQLLLQAMLNDTQSAGFVSSYLGTMLQGATALEAQELINNLPTMFGNSFNNLGELSVHEDSNGDVIINIGNEEINLSRDAGQDIRTTLAEAFRRLGLNINL